MTGLVTVDGTDGAADVRPAKISRRPCYIARPYNIAAVAPAWRTVRSRHPAI